MFRTMWSTAIVALIGTTILLTPGTSEAQRRGGGGRGSNGNNWNGNRGGENRDYNRGWNGSGGYGLGYGLGWGNLPYYGGWNSPGYGYGYGTPAYTEQPTTVPQYSFYPSSQSGNYSNVQNQLMDPNDAGFIVRVPDSNAEVWFQDYKTQQRGTVRHYESDALAPNQTYTFTIRVRWMQNGQAMDQTRQVQGRAGQNVSVDFTTQAREQVPTNPRINNPGKTQQPTNVLPNEQLIPAPGNRPAASVPAQQIPAAPRSQQGSPLNPPSQQSPAGEPR